jgi:hypothetical protein
MDKTKVRSMAFASPSSCPYPVYVPQAGRLALLKRSEDLVEGRLGSPTLVVDTASTRQPARDADVGTPWMQEFRHSYIPQVLCSQCRLRVTGGGSCRSRSWGSSIGALCPTEAIQVRTRDYPRLYSRRCRSPSVTSHMQKRAALGLDAALGPSSSAHGRFPTIPGACCPTCAPRPRRRWPGGSGSWPATAAGAPGRRSGPR